MQNFLCTVEHDYPDFHLQMNCFLCTVKSGTLTLKEHKAIKWLTKETINSVDWLPADEKLLDEIKDYIENRIRDKTQ